MSVAGIAMKSCQVQSRDLSVSDGHTEKGRRVHAPCSLGLGTFKTSSRDLRAIGVQLTKDEIARLTEIILRATGHDVLDNAQRLRPSAERLLDAARVLDDTFEYAPFDTDSLSQLLANPEQTIGSDGATLLNALRSRGCRAEDVL